jgi:hypothetical protein
VRPAPSSSSKKKKKQVDGWTAFLSDLLIEKNPPLARRRTATTTAKKRHRRRHTFLTVPYLLSSIHLLWLNTAVDFFCDPSVFLLLLLRTLATFESVFLDP